MGFGMAEFWEQKKDPHIIQVNSAFQTLTCIPVTWDLGKMQVLTLQVWSGAWGSLFLTCSKVLLMLAQDCTWMCKVLIRYSPLSISPWPLKQAGVADNIH